MFKKQFSRKYYMNILYHQYILYTIIYSLILTVLFLDVFKLLIDCYLKLWHYLRWNMFQSLFRVPIFWCIVCAMITLYFKYISGFYSCCAIIIISDLRNTNSYKIWHIIENIRVFCAQQNYLNNTIGNIKM